MNARDKFHKGKTDFRFQYEKMEIGTEIPDISCKIGDKVYLKSECHSFEIRTEESEFRRENDIDASGESEYFKTHYSEIEFEIVSYLSFPEKRIALEANANDEKYVIWVSEDAFETAYVHETMLKAKNGDAAAQVIVGDWYWYGIHVKQDYDKAAQLFQSSAEQGNLEAQDNIAYCYYLGNGVPENDNRAIWWYQKAADVGYGRATYHLISVMRALARYDNEKKLTLAKWYYDGIYVKMDLEKAADMFEDLAYDDDEEAQYYLAECYLYGYGVAEDNEEAMRWYIESASQGYEPAIDYLDSIGFYDDDDEEDDDDYYYDNDFDIGDTVTIKNSTSRYWTDLYDKSSRQNMKKEYLHYEWEITNYDENKNKFELTYYYTVTSTTGFIFKREVKTQKSISIVVTRNEITKVY